MALVIVENTLSIKDPETGKPYRNMIKNVSFDVSMANETVEFIHSNEEEIIRLTHEHYKELKIAKSKGIERVNNRSLEEKRAWEEIQTLLDFE